MPDPLQRPAQLLPAPRARLEGRQLAAGGVRQAVEAEMDRCDPWLLPASRPPSAARVCAFRPSGGHFLPRAAASTRERSSRAIQSGSSTGCGKGWATRMTGASSKRSSSTARPGARWRSRSRSHSSPARRRRVSPAAPTPSIGVSKAAPASTRSGRRRGTIGRGSCPRARAWSRSPIAPNWAPTDERGRSASWAIVVRPKSARRWRVAGSAGRRVSGRSRSSARSRVRNAAGAPSRSKRASRAASVASQRLSPTPQRTASGATPRASITARAATLRSGPHNRLQPVMSTSATPTSTASTRGERSSSASSMRSKGCASASASRSSGQTRASSRVIAAGDPRAVPRRCARGPGRSPASARSRPSRSAMG